MEYDIENNLKNAKKKQVSSLKQHKQQSII